MEKAPDYDRRIRSLRKRLALDFQPLRTTLSKGLDVLIDPEAAVLITSTVEAFCDALFNVVVKNLHDEASANLSPLDTKVTLSHIQIALRSDTDLARLITNVESATHVLECFMDDTTSRALYDRHLIATRDAKHLRPGRQNDSSQEEDEELVREHERTRSEWQKREDDPFTDVDFATVLKCVHPACTLSYNATMVLSALIRELLNALCNHAQLEVAQQRVPPELYVQDFLEPLSSVFYIGETGKHIASIASECLERFRLRSRAGSTISLRYRIYQSHGAASRSVGTTGTTSITVTRDMLFTQLLSQMCKKLRIDPTTVVGIYRGHAVEGSSSPASLSIPTGAILFLVEKKWWDHTRRNEARRGLLSSLRPQDAHVKSIVKSTESKVKRDLHQQTSAAGHVTLGSAVSASAVLQLQSNGESPKRQMIKNKPLSSPHRSEEDEGGADVLNQPNEDSLTTLLQEDIKRTRRTKTNISKQTSNSTTSVPSNHIDTVSIMEKGHLSKIPSPSKSKSVSSCESSVNMLATHSIHLMDTLDEAWLGFAAISGGVRTMKDKVQKWKENSSNGDENEQLCTSKSIEELEADLQLRVQQVEELVRQTNVARDFVVEMLMETRQMRKISNLGLSHKK